MKDTETLAGRLVFAMTIRCIHTPELAALTGISENSVYAYRSGRAEPGVYALAQMARALHVSSDWLLCLVPFEMQTFGRGKMLDRKRV